MAKYFVILAVLAVGGFALPTPENDFHLIEEDLEVFFDRTLEGPEGRIVGGTPAAEGAYPWMVALSAGQNRAFFCGGSLITNRYVLTAAHCMDNVASGSVIGPTFRMTVGSNRLNSGGDIYTARNSIKHNQYSPMTLKNDIGLFQTTNRVSLNNRVRTIPVNYDFVGGNVPVRVAGWGRVVTGGAISNTLLELRTNTIDGARCRTDMARIAQQLGFRAPAVDPNLEICTFLVTNRGTCNGDSGSPLVRNSNNQQIGVVSWGLPCARGAPDILVRLSAYRTWIRNNSR